MICSSIEELNALALQKIEEKLEGVTEIADYYQYTKYLMKKAGESRKSRDPEKTYLFLLMYMYIIKRKLPEYKEIIASNQHYLGEYKYNVSKLDNVKKELTKFKAYLIQAYDEPDEEESEEESSENDDDIQFEEESHAVEQQSIKQETTEKVAEKKPKSTPRKRRFKPKPLPGMSFPQPMIEKPLKPRKVIKYDDQGHATTVDTETHIESQSKTTPTKKQNEPIAQDDDGEISSEYEYEYVQVVKKKKKRNPIAKHSGNVVSAVVLDESNQQVVGDKIGSYAQDEKIQSKIGSSIANTANSTRVRSGVGNAIAASTENKVVRDLATNKQIQDQVGKAVVSVATNKTLQRTAGKAVHRAATDRELQKKAAKGALSAGKFGLKAGLFTSKAALKGGFKAAQAYAKYQEEQQNGNA